MSQSVATNNVLEIDRKLRYLDLRNSILKKTFHRKASEPYILPTLDK